MKYLILSLVANLLIFGILSAIGLNINILVAMMLILVIPMTISGILFFKTNLDKTYIFFNILFIDFYYYIYNVHLMDLPRFNSYIKSEMMDLEDIDILITSKDFGFDEIVFFTLYLMLIFIVLYYLKKQVRGKA
ncbi:sarA expression modulator protein Msa [Staphylococcus argenteus]|uniref:sarA expression modulator MsaC n=1 Tax=Staphylococcus argenteus TaxID=985002 RepID=UPI000911FACF|nr:sarA expression modulator MsaC [Staphylococcus argenteus]MCG9853706.1 sarA expression modulator MsaC [Staphylococcus argenteus]MDR7648702.1 sarA expression modulator MsaC [Staphylococcus argenteus]MDR7681404.1 sarA expression modulator MsaC [Staphylococcus argenteus]SGW40160.1 Protein msa [Staphylococcus argenteus]SGX15734.1 Protein msa [Staphylococcus argenteus]